MAGTYAVIGDPIEHSMSPLIHNAAFKELGMDSSYIAYRIVKESVSSVYNIEYLTQLVRTIGKSCNNIGIEYGSQTPIKLLFEMPSMIQVSYYLAPRIEN